MSGLALKPYQQDALAALEAWLRETATSGDPNLAFYRRTNRAYRPVSGLEAVPYACLRVPTGGGKTLIAAHAVARAADALLATDTPTAIWLAPSDAIVQQTLVALKDLAHPYRIALADRFGSHVRVMDVREALYARRADYDGGAVIIVSTIQAFRQEETASLNVYKDNGELMDHFTGLDARTLAGLEPGPEGQLVRSLANALRLRRPMLIVDEAHNARTALSFVTLARLAPSLIVELTATPADDSNILFHVSAAALKDAEMIKLPIVLKVDPDPKEALRLAKAKLEELDEAAIAETVRDGRRLRPVMLIQAERRVGTAPLVPAAVKQMLMEDFRVGETEIKIATGSQWELDGIDHSDPKEPTRFIITVQALREGWDCPAAYVLCTLGEARASTAVEQILGRVLRLPGAKLKRDHRLNQAYAFAATESFRDTANALAESLVMNGFERLEARHLVRADAALPLPAPGEQSVPVAGDIDLSTYVAVVAAVSEGRVTLDAGTRQLRAETLSEADIGRLRLSLPPLLADGLEALVVRQAAARSRQVAPTTAAPPMPPFRVPQLCVRAGEQLEIFGPDHFLATPWSLEQCDASGVAERFVPPGGAAREAVIDLKQDNVTISFVERVQAELALAADERDWPWSQLVRWIDRRLVPVKGTDVTQGSAQAFIKAGLQAVMERHGLDVRDLRRLRFRLIEPFAQTIRQLRDEREKQAFENLLFGRTAFEHAPDMEVLFEADRYFPQRPYEGRIAFPKHLRPDLIGHMNDEEEACAVQIEQHAAVGRWVRNIERQTSAFRLRISNQYFYPDFVAQLTDGRYAVIEYKGAGTEGPADRTDEKEAIGTRWADVTGNRFAMVKAKDYAAVSRLMAA